MNIHLLHIRKQAKRLWLWLLRKDLLVFGLFVGLAFIFWWGRAMSSPRDMDIQIPIIYTGIPEQVVFEQSLPQTLTISVRDNGKQLRHLAHQHLSLHLNLSHYLSTEEGNITLSADILRPKLQDLLLGSTTVLQITPETIESAFYVQQTKMVPVVMRALVTTASQHQLDGAIQIIPSQVQLFGNQEAIDTIHSILTDSIHITQLRDSIRLTANLIAPKAIRLHPTSVDVICKAEQFTEKSFKLAIQTMNVPIGKRMQLFPQQAEVVVRVGMSHFAEVQAEDLQVVCHYPEEQCDALPIEVTTNNPYISNIRVSPSAVEYLVHY